VRVRVALIEVLGTQVSIFVRDAPAKIPTLAKMPTQHGLGGIGEGLEVDMGAKGLQALHRAAAKVGPVPRVEAAAPMCYSVL
jgi:hypothetical protein